MVDRKITGPLYYSVVGHGPVLVDQKKKMSEEKQKWTITEEHKQLMSAFMSDFWSLIKASYEFPDDEDPGHDHYWETLVKWNDALITKYKSDPVVAGIVIGYLDGQSRRATGGKR